MSTGAQVFGGQKTFNGGIVVGSGGGAITKIITSSVSIDLASINSGRVGAITATVTGAALGNAVFCGEPTGLEAGLVCSCGVSAVDTVEFRCINGNGNTVNPALATWSVVIFQ